MNPGILETKLLRYLADVKAKPAERPSETSV